MLAWLAGGPAAPEDGQDPDATTFIEQPDTPAHVFVARAFKHSLWGTPRMTRPVESSRPQPSSSADVTAAKPRPASLLSPSKPNGILLTPGTASLRRTKSVTFGCEGSKARAFPAEHKDVAGTPDIGPGRFPTARSPSKSADVQGTSRLTAKLRDARTSPGQDSAENENAQVRQVLTDASNADWKARHESYVKKTERELKTIIAKQQAAKQYARHKDTEAQALAEQLRQEHKKVLVLEAQVMELNARLEEIRRTTAEPALRLPQDPTRRAEKTPVKKASAQTSTLPLKQPSHGMTSSRDIWADALISSPMRDGQKRHLPSRAQAAACDILPVPSPLRERNLNTEKWRNPADEKKPNAENIAPESKLDLPLHEPSSPFMLSPPKNELSFAVASPSPLRHRKPGDQLQPRPESEQKIPVVPIVKDDRSARLSKERQTSARERLAARRRARQSMMAV